jgi:hypothetical protein
VTAAARPLAVLVKTKQQIRKMNTIETKNLTLIACDQQILEVALAGNDQLSEHMNVIVPENWTEFGSRALKHSLDKLNSSESEKGWWSG